MQKMPSRSAPVHHTLPAQHVRHRPREHRRPAAGRQRHAGTCRTVDDKMRWLLSLALLRTVAAQGASAMHPIDFDGDGDIDIVKSSPIGIVWLENHGTGREWETHIISLNQDIKDAVLAHKRRRRFVDVMEGRRPFSVLGDEPPVLVVGDGSVEVVSVKEAPATRYAAQEL